MTECPACKGIGCYFCNNTGHVQEIVVDTADYDEIIMALTGTNTMKEAEEALKKGPPGNQGQEPD